MMSPDDEPQLQPMERIPSKNNLINEAFNLNSNFNVQPLTVLPPSANHFQPITHSRTPSLEVKDLKLTALRPPPTSVGFNQASKTPNSFFDQPNIPQNILAPPSKPITKTPEPTTEIARKLSAVSLTKPSTSPSVSLVNNSPNPSSMPPTILPPTSMLPPPTSLGSSGSSNPYSARGALNKKVYDNVINVAPVAPATNFLDSQAPTQPIPDTMRNTQSAQALFMPPPSASQPTQPVMTTSQSYSAFQNQAIQPTINFGSDTSNVNSNDVSGNQQNSQNQGNNNGMWNWFSQNKIVNTFVEKAKIGVESFVTTVDPQMTNYNHPANKPIYLLSSTSTPKVVNTIREAFNNTGFSRIQINSMDGQNSSQFAPQVIGFPCALQSAKEKLENTLAYMQDNECTVIALQDFIAEVTTDCWFELAVIMLKDKRKNIELTVYTEAIPVNAEDIHQLQQYTPADYNLKWSGLACRLPEKNFNFNAINANSPSAFLAYDTQDTLISDQRLKHALNTLANLFKNRMLAQI